MKTTKGIIGFLLENPPSKFKGKGRRSKSDKWIDKIMKECFKTPLDIKKVIWK